MKFLKFIIIAGNRNTWFNVIWLLLVVVTSSYFAFSLYPETYNKATNGPVSLQFQTRNNQGQYVYYVNLKSDRVFHASEICDFKNFYINKCNLIPSNQRQVCDETSNWYPISAESLGFSDISNCFQEIIEIPGNERDKLLFNLRDTKGKLMTLDAREKMNMSDPAGWGVAARWPLFFIFVFFGLKLGLALREFLFLPAKPI